MLGELTPIGGGPPLPLLKPKLLLGRQRNCDIPLCFPTISGRHCELELLDGYWFVRDLGSSNGTRVNGHLCVTEWVLPEDVLGLSGHRYAVSYRPPADKPPPQRCNAILDQEAAPMPGETAPSEVERPRHQQIWDPGTSVTPLGKLMPCGGGAPILLLRPKLQIGRNDSCDIMLRFAAVSGRHCELEWNDGLWSIRDLGSRNGIRVNDVRCQAQPLPPGSIIWIGGLRFEIVYTPEGEGSERPSPRRSIVQAFLAKAGLLPDGPPLLATAPGLQEAECPDSNDLNKLGENS